MSELSFVHLHNHTEYSLLDGVNHISGVLEKAKKYNMPAVAITDHGTLYGALDFYLQAKKIGIKPILGCEVYVAPESLEKREPGKDVRSGYHLVLLAQTNEGLSNLFKICSKGSLDGFYYKPRVDKELLRKFSKDIVALSGCLAGEVQRKLLSDEKDLARQTALEYAEIFPDRFYLEVQANELPDQELVNSKILALSKETGIPLVATNDCHYLNSEDKEIHDILLCIQTNSKVDDEKRMRSEGALHFKSPEEMKTFFGEGYKEALANTVKIAESCNTDFDLGTYKFPAYQLEHGNSMDEEFEVLARSGLKKRFESLSLNKEDESKYLDRLEYELSTIKSMGFSGYFLIVQDFISWSKEQGIPVGPGRGSAAGSLVAYSLGITNIDPLPYNLLFERFLNKERVSMPDIDVDFCEKRREEVVRYVSEKYGEENVAQITTFGSMKARGAVKDVGRALGFSFSETNQICKKIPETAGSLAEAKEDEEFKALYESNEEAGNLIDLAERLEGTLRHASVHAAGLVIGDKPLVEYAPLYRGRNKEVVSQFDMNMLEKIGLIKFDFLGLRTMTVISDTVELINKTRGEKVDIDSISLNDPAVYNLYASGQTDGLFQVESVGMKKYLKQMKPDCFEDIIAMLALYRPGPLGSGMADEFVQRKRGEIEVSYLLPELEEVLKPTYGIILYQEQVMQIAQVLSGYTLGQADILRKAMGKKKADVMEKEKENFIKGGVKNGFSEEKVKEIFEQIEKFAAYGFNKSHSAAYALISYQTAYLKAHYPAEFMASLLTSESGDHDKLMRYVGDCRKMGIDIRLPDVNKSTQPFSVEDSGIRYGLGAVKAIGDKTLAKIIENRSLEGGFPNLFEFVKRSKSSKKTIEALVNCGAMDSFGETRAAMHESIEDVIKKAKPKKKKEKYIGQGSLLDYMQKTKGKNKDEEKTPESFPGGVGFECDKAGLSEWDNFEKLKREKEFLGVYISSHPLQDYIAEIEKSKNLHSIESCLGKAEESEVCVPCLVSSVKTIYDRKQNKMAFLEIEDLKNQAKAVVFGTIYQDVKEKIEPNSLVVLKSKIGELPDEKNEALNLLVSEVLTLDSFLAAEKETIEKEKHRKKKEQDMINSKRSQILHSDNTVKKNKVIDFEKATKERDKKQIEDSFCFKDNEGNCCLCLKEELFQDDLYIEDFKDILQIYKGKTPVVIIFDVLNPSQGGAQQGIKLGERYTVHYCPEFIQEVKDWQENVLAKGNIPVSVSSPAV